MRRPITTVTTCTSCKRSSSTGEGEKGPVNGPVTYRPIYISQLLTLAGQLSSHGTNHPKLGQPYTNGFMHIFPLPAMWLRCPCFPYPFFTDFIWIQSQLFAILLGVDIPYSLDP